MSAKSLWWKNSENCCLINRLATNSIFPETSLRILRTFANPHRVNPTRTRSWFQLMYPIPDPTGIFSARSTSISKVVVWSARSQTFLRAVLSRFRALKENLLATTTGIYNREKRLIMFDVGFLKRYLYEKRGNCMWSAWDEWEMGHVRGSHTECVTVGRSLNRWLMIFPIKNVSTEHRQMKG